MVNREMPDPCFRDLAESVAAQKRTEHIPYLLSAVTQAALAEPPSGSRIGHPLKFTENSPKKLFYLGLGGLTGIHGADELVTMPEELPAQCPEVPDYLISPVQSIQLDAGRHQVSIPSRRLPWALSVAGGLGSTRSCPGFPRHHGGAVLAKWLARLRVACSAFPAGNICR